VSGQESELEVIVTDRSEAGRILSSPALCGEIDFLVSIGDPEGYRPGGYDNVPAALRLVFYDSNDLDGPTETHVRRLIAFAGKIKGRRARVLAHCEAGISRSTAAAVIIYAVALGPGGEEEALLRVFRQRPIARPNRRMIEMADDLLDRGGALIRALDQS
jgi:predicted protein tyrosine phosphatase